MKTERTLQGREYGKSDARQAGTGAASAAHRDGGRHHGGFVPAEKTEEDSSVHCCAGPQSGGAGPVERPAGKRQPGRTAQDARADIRIQHTTGDPSPVPAISSPVCSERDPSIGSTRHP